MRISIITIFIVSFIVGCKEWDYPQEFPIVLTDEVQNINAEGAKLVGNVLSLGKSSDIISHGFVWNKSGSPTLNSSSVSLEENLQPGAFSHVVSSDLEANVKYYVRAYVQTSKNVVYGNQVDFVSKGSKPPVITDFSPKEGFDGTEITITGQNFSTALDGNLVQIESVKCRVISATDKQIKVQLTSSNLVGDFIMSVRVAGKFAFSPSTFKIRGPRITALSKLSGRVGDLVTIQGEYFDVPDFISLKFSSDNGSVVDPFILSSTQMQAYVPDYPSISDKIRLKAYKNTSVKEYVYPENFTLVNSWEILGLVIPIEPYREVVRHASAVIGNSIFVAGGNRLYEYNTVTQVWSMKKDFPGETRYFGTSFSYNNKLYYGFGEGYYPDPFCCNNGEYYNDLWEYDPATDSWKLFATAPFQARSRMVSFMVGNMAYLGFGWIQLPAVVSFSDFWSFDMTTKSWASITVQPTVNSNSIAYASAFAVNNKGYILGLNLEGSNPDMWEFNPSNSSWTKKATYPDQLYGETATTINNNGLVISAAINTNRARAYEYDVAKDRWIKRQSTAYAVGQYRFTHNVNGAIYYAARDLSRLNFD